MHILVEHLGKKILTRREAIMSHCRPLGTHFEVTEPEDSSDCDVSDLLGIKKFSQILNKNTSPYFHSASLVI